MDFDKYDGDLFMTLMLVVLGAISLYGFVRFLAG